MAHQRQVDKTGQVRQDVDILKAAMFVAEGIAATVNAHVQELDKNEDAHEEIDKEKERVRNKLINIENSIKALDRDVDRRFETIVMDVTKKI